RLEVPWHAPLVAELVVPQPSVAVLAEPRDALGTPVERPRHSSVPFGRGRRAWQNFLCQVSQASVSVWARTYVSWSQARIASSASLAPGKTPPSRRSHAWTLSKSCRCARGPTAWLPASAAASSVARA